MNSISKVKTIPIVALDYSTSAEALAMVDRLGESCRFYKVGSELFTSAGPDFVNTLRSQGCEVFLDLKFHDIPNTVFKASAAAASLGVSLITVHASGGESMVRAAVEGVSSVGSECGVLAVTILTSLDSAGLKSAWNRSDPLDLEKEVVRLAGVAVRAGARGVVCSGHEAELLQSTYGSQLQLLVPGIRLAGSSTDDQARVVTPGAASKSGASYIILGRTVTGAGDPRAAMDTVWSEV